MVCTCTYIYIWYVTCTYMFMHSYICNVCCTYIYIDVDTCLDIAQTRTLLCSFTTTLHFPSGPISLATQASLSAKQEQLLLSSLLPGTSLFNWQTTQERLATPKLPQPLVHLIHIAATPGLASHLLLQCHSCPQGNQNSCAVVLLRNGRGKVTSQEQGDQWNSTHHVEIIV